MAQTYHSLWYHLVWSTKNREPLIHKDWKWELYAHIQKYCKTKDYHLDFINGKEDHVHLLISIKPSFALSDIVRDIKRDSYYWIKEQQLTSSHFSWQDGYAAFTVSNSIVEKVRNYIKNQEEHHRKQGFDDEIAFFISKMSQ
jgi:putative transposase